MRRGAICRVSAATRRALKTRTLAEEQRTPGGRGASSSKIAEKYVGKVLLKLEMWRISLAWRLSRTYRRFQQISAYSHAAVFSLFIATRSQAFTLCRIQPWDGLDLYPPSMKALSRVIMSCIFCLKWLRPRRWPVCLCVGRDLLRLGGTLPGHNRKSPDSSQEIVRQQMSQTLPIRVWSGGC